MATLYIDQLTNLTGSDAIRKSNFPDVCLIFFTVSVASSLSRGWTMFPTIYIEISGFCNARCPWCITGSRTRTLIKSDELFGSKEGPLHAKFMTSEEFGKILDRLNNLGALAPYSNISLFNWGEPFLNPQLVDILRIMEKRQIYYSLSTNASRYVDISLSGLRMLKIMTFSFSGFSQESYDKIHGFDFEQTLNNVKKIVSDIKRCESPAEVFLVNHLYQFNLIEARAASDFSRELQISYSPYCAYMNDFLKSISYLDNTMDIHTLKRASKELFLYYVDDLIKNKPADYICPQHAMLVIDEFGNVLPCCCLPKEHEQYTIGSIFDFELPELLEKKMSQPICKKCLSTGLAYWVHNPYRPEFIDRLLGYV